MKHISVIIPSLNDNDECLKTIASIRETAGADPDIIVIDDASHPTLEIPDQGVSLLTNDERIGVAACRQIGAYIANRDYILLIDAHMRFKPGWYKTLQKEIEKLDGKTGLCCSCLGLDEDHMDINMPRGEYNGATINFYGPDRGDASKMQVFEGVWLDHRKGDDYEIPCLMGACYLLPREFFFHVGGLKLLRSWGSDEPFLSLKWWLAGGSIKICKKVKIGHKFRKQSPYPSDVWHLTYNKLVSLQIAAPERVNQFMKVAFKQLPEFRLAYEKLLADWHIVAPEMIRFSQIVRYDLEWYCKKFDIPLNL